jgi:hypothetical protein
MYWVHECYSRLLAYNSIQFAVHRMAAFVVTKRMRLVDVIGLRWKPVTNECDKPVLPSGDQFHVEQLFDFSKIRFGSI